MVTMPGPDDVASAWSDAAASGLAAALRDLAFAVRALQLYPPSSPVVGRAVQRAHDGLVPFLQTGRLALAILPDAVRVGSQGTEVAGPVVRSLAVKLHERGVAHLYLDDSLQPSGLQDLAEMLATDVDRLKEQGGIQQECEQRRPQGLTLDMLQLDKLYEGAAGDGDRTTAVWEALLSDYGGGGEEEVDRELLASDDDRLADFLAWLLGESASAPGTAEMSGLQRIRAACDEIGAAAAALGPDRVDAVAEVVSRFYSNLDQEVWIDLLAPPDGLAEPTGDDRYAAANAGDRRALAELADLTRAIGGALSREQVVNLLTYALSTREQPSPRIVGLFRGLLQGRGEQDLMERAIRDAVERQTNTDGERAKLEKLWPRLTDALQGEQLEAFVSTTYRAQLEQLLANPPAAGLWDMERIAPRFGELDGSYLVRRKARVILKILETRNDDEEYARLVDELEHSLPELIVDGQYIAAEEVLQSLAADLIPSSGLTDSQRDAARGVLIRFCNQHTLREVVRNLAGRPSAQIDAASRIFASLGAMAVPELLEALSQERSRPVRVHLVRMLAGMGDQALPEIRKHLRDKRWFFVRNLLWIIGEIGDPRFVPHLGIIVNHPDVRVRREAVRALAKLRNEATTRVLLSAAQDSNPEVRLLAIRGLGIGGTPEAVPRLREVVRLSNRTGRNTESIRAAAIALGRLGATEAIDDLRKPARSPWLFRRRRFAARDAAVWAIATLRGEATGKAPEAAIVGAGDESEEVASSPPPKPTDRNAA